jgi:hypothetical protein
MLSHLWMLLSRTGAVWTTAYSDNDNCLAARTIVQLLHARHSARAPCVVAMPRESGHCPQHSPGILSVPVHDLQTAD